MADNSEFLEVVSPSAIKNLKELNDEIVKVIAGVKSVNSSKITFTPSGVDSANKKLIKDYDDMEKAVKTLQAQLLKYAEVQKRSQDATDKARLSEIKLQQAREKAMDSFEKKSQKEQAQLKASENLYNKVQTRLNALSVEYRNLATRKELLNNLTDKEAKRYEFLQGKITQYDATLKAVDATMGKYQRNVGNYASAFNPLSNSINQLTREMPAFTNSIQTGFMALSNNIPIFTDAIGNAVKQNKELQAQGKPTTSVLSQLASSFFSWQTLLGVGITLLTVYGKEIVNWATGLSKAQEEADKVKTTLLELNNQQQTSIVQIEALNKAVLDTTKTEKERLIAYEQLKETMPELEKMTMDQAISTGYLTAITARYIEAILARAKAERLASLIAEEETKNDIQKTKTIQEQSKWYDRLLNYVTKANFGLGVTRDRVKEEIGAREKTIEVYKKLYALNLLTAEQLEKELAGLGKKSTAHKKKQKEEKEALEAITLQVEAQEGLLKKLKQIRDGFSQLQQTTSSNSKEFKEYTKLIEYYQTLIDSIEKGDALAQSAKRGTEEFLRLNSAMADTSAKTKEMTAAQNGFFQSFQEGFFGDAGLPTLFKYLNGDLDEFMNSWEGKFEAITQIAQEAFNFIAEASNANFENEYRNLERQKEVALLFAGESDTARAEIERQAEARRKGIAKREFESKKQQAIFNIAIDTAQAIVATLARTPLPAGLPFVIATAALGAAQTALVLSQTAPQFWTGTDNAPEGLAWTQERGQEIITDKHGKIKDMGDNKGARLTYLNKGDKVLNNAKTMDALMFNNDLNNILTSNHIGTPIVNVEAPKIDLKPLINAINDKETASINIGKDGLNFYVRNGHTTKENLNNRINFIGKKV